MRPFLRIIVILGLLVTLGCQAQKDLEICQFQIEEMTAALNEKDQALERQSNAAIEIANQLMKKLNEDVEKCQSDWKAKLEESQQEFTQATNNFEKKIQGLQADLQKVEIALLAAVEKNNAANAEIEKLTEALDNKSSEPEVE